MYASLDSHSFHYWCANDSDSSSLSTLCVFILPFLFFFFDSQLREFFIFRIQAIQQKIHEPLIEADQFIDSIIIQINNFTLTAPPQLIDQVNTEIGTIFTEAFYQFSMNFVPSLVNPVNEVLADIVTNVNEQVLTPIGATTLPALILQPSDLGFQSTTFQDIFPRIPPFLFDDLLINENVISLNREIGPWYVLSIFFFFFVSNYFLFLKGWMID